VTCVVVWDIGGGLVVWRPYLAWASEPGERGPRAFLDRIDFAALNRRADGGGRFAALVAEMDDPEDAALLAGCPSLFGRTVQDRASGAWDVLDVFIAAGAPIHAITNWPAKIWLE
jgi:2-haloacid dehalogenase